MKIGTPYGVPILLLYYRILLQGISYSFQGVGGDDLVHRVCVLLLHFVEAFPAALYLVHERECLPPVLELAVAAHAVVVVFGQALLYQE